MAVENAEINHRRVLVTGASRGIGRAIAKRLAKDGWKVAIHYTQAKGDAESLANELGSMVSGIYQGDFSDFKNADLVFKQVILDGDLHAIVNNAGVYRPVSFLDSSDEEFECNVGSTFTVNLASPIRLMRLGAQYFAPRGGGKILNVASRVGFKAESGASTYAASKAALINFTRSLSAELAPANIRLYGIAPGWVETAMAREGMDTKVEEILSTIPLGRMAKPEDCAAAASFLLSDEADYLSGVVLDINGASYFH